jgi:hypothetical protein
VDVGLAIAGGSELFQGEAWLASGVEDHLLALDYLISGLPYLAGNVDGNDDCTVLVGVDEVAIADAHSGHGNRPSEVDNVYEGMRRNHPASQHLKARSDVG